MHSMHYQLYLVPSSMGLQAVCSCQVESYPKLPQTCWRPASGRLSQEAVTRDVDGDSKNTQSSVLPGLY